MTAYKVTDEVRVLINSDIVICTYIDLNNNEVDCIIESDIANQYNLEEIEVQDLISVLWAN